MNSMNDIIKKQLLPALLATCLFICLGGCSGEGDDFLPSPPNTVGPGNGEENAPVTIDVTLDGIGQTRAVLANVRFRVVAYKNNSIAAGNYAGTAVYRTDGSGKATIVAGTAESASSTGQWMLLPGTYAFVAYSYGADSNPAKLSGNISTAVGHNQDFMTWSRTGVSVVRDAGGNYTLGNIAFTRQCAQLQLSVTAEGFSNNKITACAATVSGLNSNSVTWSAGASSLPDTGSGGSLGMAWSSPNATTVNSNVYKVLPQSSREITVRFTSLTIDGTSYGGKVSAKVSARAFAAAGNYKITVKVKQKGIAVGGLIWAPGNLKSDFTFCGSQSEYGAYFGWNTTSTATGAYNSSNYSTSNDPCQKVAPVGTWRTPSKDELQALVNAGSVWTTFNGVNGRWFGGVNTGVFLPAAGYRDDYGTMNIVGSDGRYWSSTPDVNNNAYYLSFLSSLANINSGYDNRNFGLSVRCVKGP